MDTCRMFEQIETVVDPLLLNGNYRDKERMWLEWNNNEQEPYIRGDSPTGSWQCDRGLTVLWHF